MDKTVAVLTRAQFETDVFVPELEALVESGQLSDDTAAALTEGMRMVKSPGGSRAEGLQLVQMALFVAMLELSLSDEALQLIKGVGPSTITQMRALSRRHTKEDSE